MNSYSLSSVDCRNKAVSTRWTLTASVPWTAEIKQYPQNHLCQGWPNHSLLQNQLPQSRPFKFHNPVAIQADGIFPSLQVPQPCCYPSWWYPLFPSNEKRKKEKRKKKKKKKKEAAYMHLMLQYNNEKHKLTNHCIPHYATSKCFSQHQGKQ